MQAYSTCGTDLCQKQCLRGTVAKRPSSPKLPWVYGVLCCRSLCPFICPARHLLKSAVDYTQRDSGWCRGDGPSIGFEFCCCRMWLFPANLHSRWRSSKDCWQRPQHLCDSYFSSKMPYRNAAWLCSNSAKSSLLRHLEILLHLPLSSPYVALPWNHQIRSDRTAASTS